MSKIILLDSAPVGLITNPKGKPLALECQQWFLNLLQRGYQVVLPEIIDYEIRRELRGKNSLFIEQILIKFQVGGFIFNI